MEQQPIPLSSVPLLRGEGAVTGAGMAAGVPSSVPSVRAQGTSDKLLLAEGKAAGTEGSSDNAPSCCSLVGHRETELRGGG